MSPPRLRLDDQLPPTPVRFHPHRPPPPPPPPPHSRRSLLADQLRRAHAHKPSPTPRAVVEDAPLRRRHTTAARKRPCEDEEEPPTRGKKRFWHRFTRSNHQRWQSEAGAESGAPITVAETSLRKATSSPRLRYPTQVLPSRSPLVPVVEPAFATRRSPSSRPPLQPPLRTWDLPDTSPPPSSTEPSKLRRALSLHTLRRKITLKRQHDELPPSRVVPFCASPTPSRASSLRLQTNRRRAGNVTRSKSLVAGAGRSLPPPPSAGDPLEMLLDTYSYDREDYVETKRPRRVPGELRRGLSTNESRRLVEERLQWENSRADGARSRRARRAPLVPIDKGVPVLVVEAYNSKVGRMSRHSPSSRPPLPPPFPPPHHPTLPCHVRPPPELKVPASAPSNVTKRPPPRPSTPARFPIVRVQPSLWSVHHDGAHAGLAM